MYSYNFLYFPWSLFTHELPCITLKWSKVDFEIYSFRCNPIAAKWQKLKIKIEINRSDTVYWWTSYPDSSTQSQVILLNYKKCFCNSLKISFFNEIKLFKAVFNALMGCSNLFFSIAISIKENSRGKRYTLVFSVIFVVTR